MLQKTFIHIPGIDPKIERSLWDQGCESWQHYLNQPDRFVCESVDSEKLHKAVVSSVRALEKGNHRQFKKPLGPRSSWRAFPEFRKACVYLDIETDGGTRSDAITTIGLYDGHDFRCLLKGKDLEEFPQLIKQYSMIVTFYGGGFDLPMLHKRFPLMRLDQIHLDLCIALKQIGVSGGLKRIEKQFGIQRSPETEGLNGRDAIRLWRRHKMLGEEKALATLIAYNREDVVNLEKLTEIAYERLWEKTRLLPTLDL